MTKKINDLLPKTTPRTTTKTPPVGIVSHRGKLVTQSNALIRAGQALTLNEKRIIAFAIAQNDSIKEAQKIEVMLTAKDFAETYDIDLQNAYGQLKEAGKTLFQRQITFTDRDTITELRWIQQAKYNQKQGYIKLMWSNPILPYLFELKKEFTSYRLAQATALRSIYSWRLLELLEQFKNNGLVVVTYDDFCVAMEITSKMKSNFAHVKMRVIEPAIKELLAKENLTIEWSFEKFGRKVSKLTFKRNDNKQMALNFNEPAPAEATGNALLSPENSFYGLQWQDMVNCYKAVTRSNDGMEASKIHDEWVTWIIDGKKKPRDAKSSFLGFIKKKLKAK